jgi:outer membrane protein TolC
MKSTRLFKYIISILSLILFLTSIQAQESFTLDEAVNYAIDNHVDRKLGQLDILKADAEILEYMSIGIPKLNAKVDYQYFIDLPTSFVPGEFLGMPAGTYAELQFGTDQNLMAGLDLSAMVFDGSFFVGLQAQRLYRELTLSQYNASDKQIKYNVISAYQNCLLTRENLNLYEENIANLSKSLKETKAFYENGFVEKLDVDRLDLSLQNLKSGYNSLEQIEILNLNLLKLAMYYPIDQPLEITETIDAFLVEAEDTSLLKRSFDINALPDYESILIGEKLAEMGIKRVKVSYFPTIYAFGSHAQNLTRNKLFNENEPSWLPTTVVGLTMNLPIFSGLDKKAKIQKARITKERTLLQKEQFESFSSYNAKNRRILYSNAIDNLKSQRSTVSLAKDIYDVALIKYKEGVGSSIEVLQAETAMLTAQQNYISTLFELLKSKTDYLNSMGLL